MERRISLYVSRKHAMTWIAAAFLMLSAVVRIVLECINGVPCANIWSHMVLPVAGTVLYILIALLWGLFFNPGTLHCRKQRQAERIAHNKLTDSYGQGAVQKSGKR